MKMWDFVYLKFMVVLLYMYLTGRKKVEVLLQQMFQGEIDDDDEGPEDIDQIDSYRKNRKLTLDQVT